MMSTKATSTERKLVIVDSCKEAGVYRTKLMRCGLERDALRAELRHLEDADEPRWLTDWTREAVVARLDRLWEDLHGTDIARARTLLGRILGPAQVELTENGQAWRLTFAGNPLALFIGDRAVSFRGSGGGDSPKERRHSRG